MQHSPIEWTNFTSNPVQYRYLDGTVVWACVHASPGCLHCYAEKLALRWHRGKLFNASNMSEVAPFLDEKELHSILTYKPAAGKMCFLGDMTDIFGEWIPDELLDHLFTILVERSDVTWQILTKRAERMQSYISKRIGYAMPNVWLGVSAENQHYWDKRLDFLGRTPAVVRFVSYEPALGPISVGNAFDDPPEGSDYGKINWVIVGGESGPGARPMQRFWVESMRDQCVVADVPFFFKQWGGVNKKKAGALLDDTLWRQYPA